MMVSLDKINWEITFMIWFGNIAYLIRVLLRGFLLAGSRGQFSLKQSRVFGTRGSLIRFPVSLLLLVILISVLVFILLLMMGRMLLVARVRARAMSVSVSTWRSGPSLLAWTWPWEKREARFSVKISHKNYLNLPFWVVKDNFICFFQWTLYNRLEKVDN
jgi:hypothetical protein